MAPSLAGTLNDLPLKAEAILIGIDQGPQLRQRAMVFLLLCEGLDSAREGLAIMSFERLFCEQGLPLAVRSDNGVPFASPNALFNLSKLSVWWLRLGIAIEPATPRQPVRHAVVTHVLGTVCHLCVRAGQV